MTIQHINLVFQAEGLNHSEKVVLLAYCNYTDPHGYVWAGVDRIADDTGASPSTVKRVRSALKAKNLLATKRRVDPRTGESIPNLTRINLSLLESMRRAPKEYDDNLVEALTFDSEEQSKPVDETPSDLRMDQSDPRADLRIGQSDPTPGVNLTPPYGGVNLTPNPSVHPSDSSSSGDAGASPPSKRSVEEEEGVSSSKPSELVRRATDATVEEAEALVEALRPEAKKSLLGFIRKLAESGDLGHRLWLLRRERAQTAAASRSRSSRLSWCEKHFSPAPCPVCAEQEQGQREGSSSVGAVVGDGAR